MFTSLKNKIREETGNEVLPHYAARSLQSSRGVRGSIDSVNTDGGYIEREDYNKLQSQFTKEKEEWAFERETILEENKALEDRLLFTQEQSRRLSTAQDERDLLEGLQAQELSKVKHLLLTREQELEDRSKELQASIIQVTQLQAEVSRLRRVEGQLVNVQDELEEIRHNSQFDRSKLTTKLAQTTEQVKHLEAKVQVLQSRLEMQGPQQCAEGSGMQALITERNLLEVRLEEAHHQLQEIKSSWSSKITTLETQVGRLSRQTAEESCERRAAIDERDELVAKVASLQSELQTVKTQLISKEATVKRLESDADELNTILKNIQLVKDDEVDVMHQQIEQYSSDKTDLEEKIFSAEERIRSLQTALEKARNDKDEALLRNAQVSQTQEMCRQELRSQETELAEIQSQLTLTQNELKQANSRIKGLEDTISISEKKHNSLEESLKETLSKSEHVENQFKNRTKENEDNLVKLTLLEQRIKELETQNNEVNVLQEQLIEKNKNIKVLNQRLTDMRKTLQQELKQGTEPSNSRDHIMSNQNHATNNIHSTQNSNTQKNTSISGLDDVNFKYLRHVIVKFLTSREVEARHLTRAVSTLLHLSPEEERLLQDTLDWRMSWFGARPDAGSGQSARAIPPS